MLTKFNLAVAAFLFMVVLAGCGGGETTTAGLNGNNSGAPAPAPTNPAPAPTNPAPAPTNPAPAPTNPEPAPTNPAPDTGGGMAGVGTASLSWFPPTTYTDGSTFTDLVGHYIYMDSGNGFVKIGSLNTAGVSDYLVENLADGTYSFAVTAYDSQGVESSFSNTAMITISS